MYTDTDGKQRCSTGSQSTAAALLDFSWLATSEIAFTGTVAVTPPGGGTPVSCQEWQQTSRPSHKFCAVPLPASVASSIAGTALFRPILHANGGQSLFFTSFTPLDEAAFPPSAAIFAPPTVCTAGAAPKHDGGIAWQVLLGATVGAFIFGIALSALVVYCRPRKQEDEHAHAYEAALLDVM